eukprot:6200142-Pleurochrysis_carterae.AAC.2
MSGRTHSGLVYTAKSDAGICAAAHACNEPMHDSIDHPLSRRVLTKPEQRHSPRPCALTQKSRTDGY